MGNDDTGSGKADATACDDYSDDSAVLLVVYISYRYFRHISRAGDFSGVNVPIFDYTAP